MDFNSIYETIAPYLSTGAIASAIIAIIGIVIKFARVMKDIKGSFSSTESEALKAFKKAIPESLYINLETITKTELAKIKEEFSAFIDEKFLAQIKANTELTQAIAAALCSMRSIPDSQKEIIKGLLELEEPKTTESLKVELIPTAEEQPQINNNIYIE